MENDFKPTESTTNDYEDDEVIKYLEKTALPSPPIRFFTPREMFRAIQEELHGKGTRI